MAILECVDLCKRFDAVQALDNINLKVEPGRVVAAATGGRGPVPGVATRASTLVKKAGRGMRMPRMSSRA